MKVFIGLSLLVALTAAEPVGFRQQDQQQRQYYLAQVKEEQAEAPYPPSGFRPAGPAFDYPQKQNGFERQYLAPSAPAATTPQRQYGAPAAPAAPQRQYGSPAVPQRQYGAPSAPQKQYGAPAVPQQQYGAPQEATTTELPYTTEAEEATTVPTEFESEPVTSVNELDDEESIGSQQQQQSGQYYIALPDGRLQRVQYVSRQDVEAMKYFAKIRAENVEPLRGPIYAYAPLQKLQVLPAGLQLTVAPAGPIAPVAAAAITAEPARSEKLNLGPAKLEIEPVTQIQYRYENPSEVIPLGGAPLSSSYTSFNGKYQLPASESRFLLTYQ